MIDNQAGDGGLHHATAVEDLVGQLRALADRTMHSVGGLLPSSLPAPPGALSATQIRAIEHSVSAQRTQIAAIIEQLTAVDDQLSVLDSLLRPLVEWSEMWAKLEKTVIGLGGRIAGAPKPAHE